jgi:hypothetical protein
MPGLRPQQRSAFGRVGLASGNIETLGVHFNEKLSFSWALGAAEMAA